MTHPILTISILISNRPSTVRKCLDSIQPLLEAIPSELIVTDTGCGAEVRSIIEEYTSHIIDFTWCQDFSAARNIGLNEAEGQWFMYLDDDEWFEDTSEIIDFFRSKESEAYGVACYVQRNFYAYEENAYVDHYVDRILRKTPELHFEHRVHEAYVGADLRGNGKKKVLSDYVNHYGYIVTDTHDKRTKSERNQALLEMECQEHPDDMRMWYQLVTNYFPLKKWDEAIEVALPLLEKQSDSEYWDLIHTSLLFCLEQKQDWETMITYCRTFFEKEMHLHEMMGTLQYALTAFRQMNMYDDARKVSLEALSIYERYQRNPEDFNKTQIMNKTFFENDVIEKMFSEMMDVAIHTQDEELIGSIFFNDNVMMLREVLQEPNINQKILIPSLEYVLTQSSDAEFAIWEEYIFRVLPENTKIELWWFVNSFDRKLQRIEYYVKGITDYRERAMLVIDLLSGYEQTAMLFYEEEMKKDIALQVEELVQNIQNQALEDIVKNIRYILERKPQWKNAFAFLLMWLELIK